MKNGHFVGHERIGGNSRKNNVIVLAPEQIGLLERDALISALQRDATNVHFFRDDVRLHSEQMERQLRRARHFVLVVGNKPSPRERQSIKIARAAGVPKFAIICLESCDALVRHRDLAKSGRIALVVVRAQLEHHRIRQILDTRVSYTLVAEDIVQSAREIGRGILGP